ncbi:site-specific integrase [Rhizobium yanglingense]
MAALCGLRRGEILALRWQDVDLGNAALAVRESAEQVGNRRQGAHCGPLLDRFGGIEAAPSRPGRRRYATRRKFIRGGQIDGKPLKPVSLTDEWTRLLAKTSLRGIRFHDLRHFHATQVLAAGVHPKIASEPLGHSTIGITLDLYSHVMRGMQANAAEQVDAAIKAAKKPAVE